MSDQDNKRQSETALFATMIRATDALTRQSNDEPGIDDLAILFLPPHIRFLLKYRWVRERFVAKNDEMTPGAFEYVLARTRFFDSVYQQALNDGLPQIVVMGAGYDSRVYRFPSTITRVFELDNAATQQRKLKCLKNNVRTTADNLTLLPVNFNIQSMSEVLEGAGYHSDQETLFLAEGVTMYLQDESINSMLSFVAEAATGSRFACDYVLPVSADNRDNYHGVHKYMETWEKHRKDEPFTFTASEDHMCSRLSDQGLRVTAHYDDSEIRELFLAENGSAITGFFRFITAERID